MVSMIPKLQNVKQKFIQMKRKQKSCQNEPSAGRFDGLPTRFDGVKTKPKEYFLI
jgi:hypothetical protein